MDDGFRTVVTERCRCRRWLRQHTVRCPAFTQIGGVAIARSDTFPGDKVCGTDLRMHTCDANGAWVASATACK